MPRLISFGCSNTYGEGLPDCWDDIECCAGPKSSKYAWPQLTADALNLECVNLGVPGTSNKQICNDVLNTKFEKNDIVAIMWTYFTRTCFFQDKRAERFGESPDSKRIIVQDTKNPNRKRQKYNSIYYKNFYTETNSNIENYMYINLVNSFLKEKKIQIHHITCNNYQQAARNIQHNTQLPPPQWNCINLIKINHLFVDLALDRQHPGVISQKNVSELVIEQFRESQ